MKLRLLHVPLCLFVIIGQVMVGRTVLKENKCFVLYIRKQTYKFIKIMNIKLFSTIYDW